MSEIAHKLEQLQLTTVSQELDRILADAASRNLSHAQTPEWLPDTELEGRRTRSIERRFRLSKLQAKVEIDAFNFNHHKSRIRVGVHPSARLNCLNLLPLRSLRICVLSFV